MTCLRTLYKIVTTKEKHISQNNILTEQQNECRKQSQGCKEQLIIDSILIKERGKQQWNLTICYIDYKK